MKLIINPRREALLFLISLLPLIVLLVLGNKVPAEVPSHINVNGHVDDYSSKYFPAILALGIYLLLLFIPMFDPRKRNYLLFAKPYFTIRLVIGLLLSVIAISLYYASLGYAINLERIIISGVLLLFIVMGNFMRNIRPNWFFGIRTPWTLENETVWTRTHRLGSKLWFAGGLVLLALSFFLKGNVFVFFMVGGITVIGMVPIVYSWWLYNKLKKGEES